MTWTMRIELEFPVQSDDVQVRYVGDAEVAFAARALERIRPALERLRAEIGPEAHYHLQLPKRENVI